MKCEKCGQSVPEGSVFCNHCGNPLNPEIVCPVCGKNIPANSVFCPKCGKMVRDDMRDDDAEPTQQAGVAAAGGATFNELERGRQQHSAHDRDPWDEKQREHEQQAHRKPYYPDDKDDDDDDDDDDVSSEPNHFNRNVIIGAAVVVVLIGLLLMLRNCGSSDSDDRHTGTGSDATMLEADANGIMVPHLMSLAEAREIVHWTRFAPLGRRPVDGGNADGLFGGLDFQEYLRFANANRMVIVQIEDPEPLSELDQICQVEGIDMIFFGPGDFSQAIGHPGEFGHPEIERTRKLVLETAHRHGKFAGTVCVPSVAQCFAEGFDFVNCGSDVAALSHSMSRSLEIVRNALERRK